MKVWIFSLLLLATAPFAYAADRDDALSRPNVTTGKDGYKVLNVRGFDKYCNEFNNSSNDQTIRPLLSELRDKNYSVVDAFSEPACMPFKNNETHTLMPMFHYTAESPDNSVNFPKHLFEFFKKNQDPDGFVKVVNAKNKLGQTFLDYLKLRYDDEKSRGTIPEMEVKYLHIFKYVCERGGQFSFYKQARCADYE